MYGTEIVFNLKAFDLITQNKFHFWQKLFFEVEMQTLNPMDFFLNYWDLVVNALGIMSG